MSSAPSREHDARRIAIIGLGAIGGSVALALIADGRCPTGYAVSEEDRSLAEAAGVSVAASVEQCVAAADIVLLAVPMHALPSVADRVLSAVSAQATVLHASSLQRPDAVKLAPAAASRVFGTHPLAGSQASGFAAAHRRMLVDATVYIESRMPANVRRDAEQLWKQAGASTIAVLDAADHDTLMARASHLPQLVATALASALAAHGVDPTKVGPGARDTTRLAASSLDMWEPLLASTPADTLIMLAEVETQLASLRVAIEQRDTATLHRVWDAGRAWRQAANPISPSTTGSPDP